MTAPISATLITLNEAENIGGALQSLAWVDEIVVVDSGSTDRTLEDLPGAHRPDIASPVERVCRPEESRGSKCLARLDTLARCGRTGESGADCRNTGPPFLRVSPSRLPDPASGLFHGRWIRHGDWYPDPQLRLFDRRRGVSQGGRVHESVRVRGSPGYLRGEIHHFTYRSLADYLKRLDTYSTLAAADYRDRGRRATAFKLLTNPPVTFLKGYLMRQGFRDGVPGFMVAVMAAVSVYFKYAKLYEMGNSGAFQANDK